MDSQSRREIAENPELTLITACPSSFRSLKDAFPKKRILFYWDLMQDVIGIPQEEVRSDVKLLLHREDTMADSIRWVLDKLGCQWEDTDEKADLSSQDRDCRQILGLLFGTGKAEIP